MAPERSEGAHAISVDHRGNRGDAALWRGSAGPCATKAQMGDSAEQMWAASVSATWSWPNPVIGMNALFAGDMVTGESLARIEEQVQGQLTGRVRAFKLICRERGLVMQSRTRTYYAKQLAEQLVTKATCLPIWVNEIEVS